MLYRVVGTSAGVFGYALFPALLIAALVTVPILGPAPGNAVAMPLIGVACFSVGVGLALAFLNGVGISPWIDDPTGRFVRPEGRRLAFAVAGTAVAVMVAIAFLCIAILALLGFVAPPSETVGMTLAVVAGGGILLALTGAALAAAVLMLGWPGIFVGLAFGAGFVATVVGVVAADGTALGFGIAGLAVACAGFYAGGQLSRALPATLAHSLVSGVFVAQGIVAFVVWWFTRDYLVALFGALSIAASAGYFVAVYLQRRRDSAAAAPAPRKTR